jgi:hypothetical protein
VYDFTQFDEDQVNGSIRYAAAPHLALGVEGNMASVRYRTGDKADATLGSVGPFFDWNVTPFTRLRVAGGFQGINFNGDTARSIAFLPSASGSLSPTVITGTAPVSDQSSPYFNAQISNRLTKHFEQTLSGGREMSLDITAASLDIYYVRYRALWEISSLVTLNGDLFYDQGRQQGADFPDHFNRIGCGLSTTLNFSRKLSGSLGYHYIRKDSDLPGNSYRQNLVSLWLRYQF